MVGTVSVGRHGALGVCVGPVTRAAGCSRAGTGADCQTSRARVPPYQPIRYARTRTWRAIVETNSRTGWPGSTLSRSV